MHLVFILISMTCLGITNFLFKFSSASLDPTRSTFYYYLFGLGLSCIAVFMDKSKREFVPQDLMVPALISGFLFVSILTYNYALNNMSVSKASTIRSLSFVVTVILALVITKDKLFLKDYLAIGLAASAIILLGWPTSVAQSTTN